ncbi:ABC transporter substrate-binding protein, partial [Burkholderia multivorans]|uniref:DUF5983 family protein n=2 Tax=Burkholderia multivorans TaxID=87883 RepID=UPI003F57C7AF
AAYHLAASSQSVRHSVRRAIHRRHQLRSFNRPQHTKFLTRPVVQRLGFETGYYSRCWEISSAHISQETGQYLASLADLATPEAFLFIAFRVPYSPAIGVKLISTPWTDKNLEYAEGISAEQLRQEHRDKGMPDDLANILELAGQADVRILILDADAPALLGLPLAEI